MLSFVPNRETCPRGRDQKAGPRRTQARMGSSNMGAKPTAEAAPDIALQDEAPVDLIEVAGVIKWFDVAKGYGSFEAFLEREIDLGKQTSLKLIKIAHLFQREAALDYGTDRLFAAISALEGDTNAPKSMPSQPSTPGLKPPLPLKPPMRIVG